MDRADRQLLVRGFAQEVSVRLTPARKAKYLALGGNAWLNKAIDRAKVKE